MKILGVHFGSSFLDNPNWKNDSCKFSWKRIVNQIVLSKLWYIGQIYTIYHKATWKNNTSTPYLVLWQGIIKKKSASGSRTLPCVVGFFQSPILIWKCQKSSLNRGTLVPAPSIYQTKCPFLFLGCFPMIEIIPCVH